MRFSLCRWLLPVVIASASACSEQRNSSVAKQTQPVPAVANTAAVSDTAERPTGARPVVAATPTDTSDTHDVASYLGGLPVKRSSGLRALTAKPEWQSFAADADANWAKYHASRTTKIQAWAKQELDSVQQQSSVVFYPFSGPDFLNAATMFPGSQAYVLVGLEPVGSVPGQASLQSPKLYHAIKTSLWSVLSFSFFRTNSMAVDLKSLELDGALPLIMLFAARTNHLVTDVQYLHLSRTGEALPPDSVSAAAASKLIPGVLIKLRASDGQEKKVYYFSADLSDWKLGQNQRRYPALCAKSGAAYHLCKIGYLSDAQAVLQQSAQPYFGA
ncbi:hypothetical protein [Hymenobacter latericus]|uniref:hypothetical protein n=1 Tax=Hymenobacter sp. YIM 151858-1 TaxID=2987688 RepID=UPI0022265856|nr:hypothetical protein [Hymenobacter sp. YIM 151858-1]UYZ57749.1 hypothetical protein OIS50_11810 [Hymenobacter sp. YIM 151858-1]